MPGAISCCAAVIDNSAQCLEERRSAVNLIDHDELANLSAQKCVRVLEAPLISRALEVKVYRDRGVPQALPEGQNMAYRRRWNQAGRFFQQTGGRVVQMCMEPRNPMFPTARTVNRLPRLTTAPRHYRTGARSARSR